MAIGYMVMGYMGERLGGYRLRGCMPVFRAVIIVELYGYMLPELVGYRRYGCGL